MLYYRKFAPAPPLAPYVECYYVWEWTVTAPTTLDAAPSGFGSLVVNYGTPYRVSPADEQETAVPATFLTGQALARYRLHLAAGRLGMIGAVLRPAGAAAFFDLPAFELTENRLDFSLIRHREARELRERIGSDQPPAAKVRILEDYLRRQLDCRNYELRSMDRLANAIHDHHGLLTMDELLATAFMSRRTFERRFLSTVGLSPKYYARICRIARICYLLSQSSAVDWQFLIGSGDYYDQAHFCRDFKSFMGATPTAYAERNTELRRYLYPAES